MCGINGIVAYHSASSAPEEAELLATREVMRARGPDGAGTWWNLDRRCGLAHRRLSIVDLSDRASQPMTSEDGRFVVVFNGEIYNYLELRAQLETDGVLFRTASDTEVLLHLYARHGAEMVHRLRGMFAFAIWDQAQRGLFLARDPYGIKPLYTANDGWTFRFASQVKALVAGGHISRDPEPAGIVGFHLFGSVPEPFTLYRDVRSLPAGHTQWVDAAGPREPKPFSNLAEVLAKGAANPAPAAEIPERVRTGVLDSVRAHLLADVEVGIFLSAGVDSGALLGCMRDAGQHEIRAITLAFEEFHGTSEDEAPLAARVCERYRAHHIVRHFSEQEFVEDLPMILEAMDQPSIDGVNTWFVAKAAKEAGLKVVISGLGGDELLGGYPSFLDVPRWHRRFGPLAAVPGVGFFARKLITAVAPAFSRAMPKALGVLEYSGSWAGTYLLRRGLFLPHELPEVMDAEIAREGLRRLEPLHRIAASLKPDPGSDIARVCVLESAHYMRNQLLRDADWAGMAHSLEIRVPLVDFTLLRALAPAIPALTPGAGKAALAKAPTMPLPNQIVTRAKTGFGVPIGNWMKGTAREGSGALVRAAEAKGDVFRRWSGAVFNGGDLTKRPLQAHAS
ncbi:MAG: asparagine synthase (glutamine-hydrolyzing) [Terriglobales bacterium]|jgi:asparagine synthase (glutamine-hydrolysing)